MRSASFIVCAAAATLSACSFPMRPAPSCFDIAGSDPRVSARRAVRAASLGEQMPPALMASSAGAPDPDAASSLARRAMACSVSARKPRIRRRSRRLHGHPGGIERGRFGPLELLDQSAHRHGSIMTRGCHRVRGTGSLSRGVRQFWFGFVDPGDVGDLGCGGCVVGSGGGWRCRRCRGRVGGRLGSGGGGRRGRRRVCGSRFLSGGGGGCSGRRRRR